MFAIQLQRRCLKNNIKPVMSYIVGRNFSTDRQQPQDPGIYRGESAFRCGYKAHHHAKGMLPRLKIKERRISTMPLTIKEDEWSPRLATMGQNDFIRILGDESINQHDLLTHVPDWLRGFKANKEYSVLMRKRKEFEHWRYTKPLKWLHLEQRIKYLYRRINNKYRPPNVELLRPSRHSV